MGDRDSGRTRCFGARERGVRVAVDEHPVGFLRGNRSGYAGSHCRRVGCAQVEPVARLVDSELGVEDRRHRIVVVLTRVDDDLLDPGFA